MEDDEEKRREWADFRFEVIAPLVCGEYSRSELEIIRRGILAKCHTNPAGQRWFVAERTLRKWVACYRKDGFPGLYDSRRSTRGIYKAIPAEILGAAAEKRKELPSRSIKDILHQLEVEGLDVSNVSKTTLNEHLNKLGMKKEKPYSDQGAYQRWQKRHINALWQTDCSDGVWLPDPTGLKKVKMTSLITFIDDASRVCTHGEFYWNEQLPNLMDCFRKAVAKRGLVTKLYMDNGSIFRSKQWQSVCADLGIGRRFAEKQRASGKGKVERHYLTIQKNFYKEASHADLKTLEELNEFFWAWLELRYHNDIHSGIKQRPIERWQQEEHKVKRVSPERVREALKLRVNRKVNFRTALISIEGRQYQASKALGGDHVQVRWPFDCTEHVEIWKQGEFVEIAKLYVTPTDIDYSKRPVREPEVKPGTVLPGSTRYRHALVAKYKGSVFKPEEETDAFLTDGQFLEQIAKILGRELSDCEKGQCSDFYMEWRPFRQDYIQAILERSIAEKGQGRHIKFYLRRIEDTKLKMR